MKITLGINDELLASAKALAARQWVSLTRLIEEGLLLRVRGERTPTTKRRRGSTIRISAQLANGSPPLSNPASTASPLH